VSSSVREIVLEKGRFRVSLNASVPTRDCVHLYRGRDTEMLRRVCTVQVGTTGNEWFSRYEATNYCILYVYVPDLYPTWGGSVWILEVDNLEINGGTGPRAVLCSLSRCLARYGRCHVSAI
jgi:hypothetical protein